MYLALFFMPWMLMYALSTIAMNHRDFFNRVYGGQTAIWELDQEQIYPETPPASDDAKSAGLRILAHLGLDGGSYDVRKSSDGQRITILRDDPVVPRRIVFTVADKKLVVEKQVFRLPAFLERLHRRRGFQSEYFLSDAWSLIVDLVIAAIVLWGITGMWMWWQLKKTRTLGALVFVGGVGVFMFFLYRI